MATFRGLAVRTGLAWIGLILCHYNAYWLGTRLPTVGYFVAWWLPWIPVVILSLFVGAWLFADRRWIAATLVAAVMIAAAIQLSKPEFYTDSFFGMNRSKFAEVARLAEARQLDLKGYYGGDLPSHLRHLSVNGRAAELTEMRPHAPAAGAFIPRWMGWPDGAIGYAYFYEPPVPGAQYDGFADVVYVRRDLGGGWYWLA